MLKNVVVILFIWQAAIAMATPGPENFDSVRTGQLPSGWVSMITGQGEPKWSVEQEATTVTGSWVLKQSAWTPKPSYPLCIKTNLSLKNGFLEVRFKPVSGTNDQAAGLVWRFRDPENYYVVRANALEDNVVLYKVEKGKRTALDIVGRKGGYGVTAKVPKGEWSTLRVYIHNQRFAVSLNQKELFAVEDSTFVQPGAGGVWTKADSVTLFKDFSYEIGKE